MTATVRSTSQKGKLVIHYVGEAAIGNQGNIANPEGETLLITRCYTYLITPSTGAATLDVGVAATGVDNGDLHGALPLNGGAGTGWQGYEMGQAQDAALTTPALWTPTTFITFTTAAADATPCVADIFIEYTRLTGD